MASFRGYASKAELLDGWASGKNVLHLGAVGETVSDLNRQVAAAPNSVHAHLTEISARCIGIDTNRAAVEALTDRGIFDNLLYADAVSLSRADVALPSIDVIVAGDLLEHLSCPGAMLDAIHALSDPSTVLLITSPNAFSLLNFLRNSSGKTLEGPDHVGSYNVFTLSNLLIRHSWHVKEVWTCHQDRATASFGFSAGRLLFKALPRWGGTLFVVTSLVQRPLPTGSGMR